MSHSEYYNEEKQHEDNYTFYRTTVVLSVKQSIASLALVRDLLGIIKHSLFVPS